jgi:hypothetical protein
MNVPSDETLVAGLLMDLRGEARQNLRVAERWDDKPDIQNHVKELAESQFNTARALHRILLKAGIKGLGPVDY